MWSKGSEAAFVLRELLGNYDEPYVARKVLRKSISENNCTVLETENIHPIELFDRIRVESQGEYPSQYSYERVPSTHESPKLTTWETIDAPLKSCTDTTAFPEGDIVDTSGIDGLTVRWNTWKTRACILYKQSLPGSFNYNWDSEKQASKEAKISIMDGVNCNNCYAYLGAGFNVLLEYVDSTFMFQAKIGGSAGFSVELDITDPNIEEKIEKNVINEETDYTSSNIGGTGVSLGTKSGGLKIILSGSGKGAGSVKAGAAASVSAVLSMKV